MGMRHTDIPAELNHLTERVIGAAIEVHRELGPGLLERSYEAALLHELSLRGIRASTQVEITPRYKEVLLPGQRLDLVIDGRIVVELKAVETVSEVHLAQLVSYLKAGGFPFGLLLNFNVPVLRTGIFRRINNTHPLLSAPPRDLRASAF